MSNATEETLYILAHPRSDPAVYFTAHTLPASGAATDPNAGTAGDGLAIAVPTWAVNAMVFVSYAIGPGGNVLAGLANAIVYVGKAVGSPLVALYPSVANSNIDVAGASLLAANIGGAWTIGVKFNEAGDAAHPGIVTVSVVFSR